MAETTLTPVPTIESVRPDFNAVADAVRIESQRFKLTPIQRSLLDELIAQTLRVGRWELVTDYGLSHLAAALHVPSRHLRARALAVLVLNGAVTEVAGEFGARHLAVELNFARWSMTQHCTSRNQWEAMNRVRVAQGLTPWLLAPELDLNGALALTGRESFIERTNSGAQREASAPEKGERLPKLGSDGRSFGRELPKLGSALPNLGSSAKSGSELGEVEERRMNIDESAPTRSSDKTGCPRARARVSIERMKLKELSIESIGMAGVKERLRSGIEAEFIEAGEAIMGAAIWTRGEHRGGIGEGGKWRLRWRHQPSRDTAVEVFEEMLMRGVSRTPGAQAEEFWKLMGGKKLDRQRLEKSKESF